jgi:hypothetical protein
VELAAVLQRDAIIGADDIAVGDADAPAPIEVDPIGIGELHIRPNADSGDQHVFAPVGARQQGIWKSG